MIIATPKVFNNIKSNKKKLFIINAKNIIIQIEYENIEFSSFAKTPLSDLEQRDIRDNLDVTNFYAYMADDKIYLDLKDINEYKDMYLCNTSSTKKNLKARETLYNN